MNSSALAATVTTRQRGQPGVSQAPLQLMQSEIDSKKREVFFLVSMLAEPKPGGDDYQNSVYRADTQEGRVEIMARLEVLGFRTTEVPWMVRMREGKEGCHKSLKQAIVDRLEAIHNED